MRSSVKKDINATCAELVYGTTLRLPSGLFSTDKITATCNGRINASCRDQALLIHRIHIIGTSENPHLIRPNRHQMRW
ncbi:hypothetical protein TNCV_3668481 [Trichonephila clavipes]|nr:hypothetical protein TNCV_3668481 [Trichonephila clavipes]